MIRTHRPRSQFERSLCLAAIGPLDDPTALSPVVAAIVLATFATARRDYEAGAAEVSAASTAVVDARKARNDAEASFDFDFRLWESTVVDPAGKAMPKALAVVLGGDVPSRFIQQKPALKADLLIAATPQLAGRGLAGDPARLGALTEATTALWAATCAYDAAVRARRSAVAAQTPVRVTFDDAYGKLAEAMLEYDPDALAKLPVFYRSAPDEPAPPEPDDADLPDDPPDAPQGPAEGTSDIGAGSGTPPS